MKYRSAIDWWVVGIILSVLALPVFFPESSTIPERFPTLIVIAIVLGLMVLLTWPCHYILEDKHLHIRCGLIKRNIPYPEIRSVKKSVNPLSAPALSLRRVRIDYGASFTLVSPTERDKFIQELRRKSNIAA